MKGPRQVKSPGRPSKLTQEACDAVAANVRRGMFLETAAWGAGVDYHTLRRWREKGLSDIEAGIDSDEAAFCTALKRAEAEQVGACLDDLGTTEGQDGWQARAWLLERRHGYVKTERQEVTATVAAKVQQLTDEELEAEVRGALGDAGGHDTG